MHEVKDFQKSQQFISSSCMLQVRHWFAWAVYWDRTPVPDSAVYGRLNPESSTQELFRGARGLSSRNHCSKGQPARCLNPFEVKIELAILQQGNPQADFQLWIVKPSHITTSRDHTLGHLERRMQAWITVLFDYHFHHGNQNIINTANFKLIIIEPSMHNKLYIPSSACCDGSGMIWLDELAFYLLVTSSLFFLHILRTWKIE